MESIGLSIAVSVITSVLTFIVIEYFKRSGKITVHLTNAHMGLIKPDDRGGQEPTVFIKEATEFNLSLVLDIYNSSEIPKSLREIGIEFKPKRRFAFSLSPHVPNPNGTGWNMYRRLDIISLPSRELIKLDLQCWDRHIDLESYQREIKVSWVAKYPNGLKFRKYLGKIDLNKNFSGFVGKRFF